MDLIALLEKDILAHPYLKDEDADVVRRICQYLRIADGYGYVNEYIRQQVEIEAGAVYLTCRYETLRDKLLAHYEEVKADRFIDLGDKTDEGYKWTKKDKEQWLLGTDTEYATQVELVRVASGLLNLLKGLYVVVFGRDRKLEQLSINYRRELEGDKRVS